MEKELKKMGSRTKKTKSQAQVLRIQTGSIVRHFFFGLTVRFLALSIKISVRREGASLGK